MNRSIRIIVLIAVFSPLFAQHDTLNLLGKASGGACASVEYKDGRLYAGVGASMWVFDATDPLSDYVIARREFLSLVTNIIVQDDTTVFVGVNHDGLYALDGKQPDLPVLASYLMPDHSHWVSDIEPVSHDTIWLCDINSIKKICFTGNSFVVLASYFDGRKIAGVAQRDTLLIVCTREILSGNIELYNIVSGEPELIDIYSSPVLSLVMDAQFADLRDDIVYVLGGSPNLGVNGDFIALRFDGDSLYEVARHNIHGIPMMA